MHMIILTIWLGPRGSSQKYLVILNSPDLSYHFSQCIFHYSIIRNGFYYNQRKNMKKWKNMKNPWTVKKSWKKPWPIKKPPHTFSEWRHKLLSNFWPFWPFLLRFVLFNVQVARFSKIAFKRPQFRACFKTYLSLGDNYRHFVVQEG